MNAFRKVVRMRANARPRFFLGVLLGLALFLGVGCKQTFPRSRFIANYSAEHDTGTETLQLLGDGTYVHRFKEISGTESTSTGTWEFLQAWRKQEILVHKFRPHFPNRTTEPTDWTLEPYEDYGLIRLYLSRQPRQFYLEVSSKRTD
jgi:hypothetical protein